MRPERIARCCLILVLVCLSSFSFPRVHAPIIGGNQYYLSTVPSYAQEGTRVSLVLQVILGFSTTGNVYSFRFNVRDPLGATVASRPVNYTTSTGQTEFSILVAYPGPDISGTNSLVGLYNSTVDQLQPSNILRVASSSFVLGITDSAYYERTQTVNVQGTGYGSSEIVDATIKTKTTGTTVLSQILTASSTGVVTASWKIPVNATIDNYLAYLNGTTTHKTPPDAQTFSVRTATVIISGISSAKSIYQRTETMKFSFQPTYPDGSTPTTGVGLLTLTGASGGKTILLTASYDSVALMFAATYKTTPVNQTGTWTATLGTHGYSDLYGNTGPGIVLTNTPQLTVATLTITVATNTNLAVGQQLRLNATVSYPDGTPATSSNVRSYLIYSGTPAINDTIPIVYDSILGLWEGTHTTTASDSGGLWSLIVIASDSSSPQNTGSATRAVNIQNNGVSNTSTSFPLYYFGILAAIIAGILIAALLVFKKRRVGHARLKIDLEAVHSEAGRIESQEFFKTIRDQVNKEKDG